VRLIVASRRDTAGVNIAQQILGHYEFSELPEGFRGEPAYSGTVQGEEVRLVFVGEEPVYTQYLNDLPRPQLVVFVSRHSSTSGIPTLSVHTPGNLGEARLGGIPGRVSVSPASAMKRALMKLAEMKAEMGLDYTVSYEATHHGPSLDAPTMFVELGSSPRQWEDLRAAEAVAHAAMAALTQGSKYPAALGVGGPHYNAKFTRVALTTQTAFGHMIPKYAIPRVDAETVGQCLERTEERVESVVLDWKGIMGAERERLVAVLAKTGLPVKRI